MLGPRDVLAAIHRGRGRAPGPRAGQDDALRTTGYLLAYDSGTYTATVSVHGSAPIPGVPAVAVDYTGITTVHVLLRGGRPVQVLGPASDLAWGSGGEIPSPPDGDTSATRWVTDRVVAPEWSGTYRTDTGEWDAWGTTTRGGRSDVWQANPPPTNLVPDPNPTTGADWSTSSGLSDLDTSIWPTGADPEQCFVVYGVAAGTHYVYPVASGVSAIAVSAGESYTVTVEALRSAAGSVTHFGAGVDWYDSGGSFISQGAGSLVAPGGDASGWEDSGGPLASGYSASPSAALVAPGSASYGRPFLAIVEASAYSTIISCGQFSMVAT